MSERSRARDPETGSERWTDGGSRLLRQAKLALSLWKIWAVGVLFLLIAWIAFGMQGLNFVVEPFYLLFAVLAFGYGIRRFREKLEQSYI